MPNYHGNSPYTHFTEHKMKYARGYHSPSQKNIGHKNSKSNSYLKSNSYKKVNQSNHEKANHGNGGSKNTVKNNHDKGGGNGKKR